MLLSEASRSPFPDFHGLEKINDVPFGRWYGSLRKTVSLAKLFSLANDMVNGRNFVDDCFAFG